MEFHPAQPYNQKTTTNLHSNFVSKTMSLSRIFIFTCKWIKLRTQAKGLETRRNKSILDINQKSLEKLMTGQKLGVLLITD